MLETSSYSPKIKKQPLIVLLQAIFGAKRVADPTKLHTVATCIDKQVWLETPRVWLENLKN